MKLIYQDDEKQQIQGEKVVKFNSYSNYHLISLTVRVKGEKQLDPPTTDDEDLTVQINKQTYPQLTVKGRHIDSPAAFSGGKLHNLAKTIYFLIFLRGKNHVITLQTDGPANTATFEDLKIYTFKPTNKLILKPNLKAENGDLRPWVAFSLERLPLKEFKPNITLDKEDKIEIKIDGRSLSKSFIARIKKFFYRLIQIILPWFKSTNTYQEKTLINLQSGLHYIEIAAQGTPTLNQVSLNFGETLPEPEWRPTVSLPKWTGDFYDDTEIMLLSRAIYGEMRGESKEAKIAVGWTIKNRVEDIKQRWGNTYHQVILTKYQYQPFNNPQSDAYKKISNPPLENFSEKKAWELSYQVAKDVVSNKIPDLTQGANHFYSPSLEQNTPDWADNILLTLELGHTKFYKL